MIREPFLLYVLHLWVLFFLKGGGEYIFFCGWSLICGEARNVMGTLEFGPGRHTCELSDDCYVVEYKCYINY